MSPIAHLRAVTIDCPNPQELSDFYQGLTDWQVIYSDSTFVGLSGAGIWFGFQRVSEYHAPQWPDPSTPQQIHLDFFVDDLDTAERQVIALGARKPDVQPGEERWRVFIDPVGHPFCLTLNTPATDALKNT